MLRRFTFGAGACSSGRCPVRYQLGDTRGPNGEPSATDFLVLELPAIVEAFGHSATRRGRGTLAGSSRDRRLSDVRPMRADARRGSPPVAGGLDPDLLDEVVWWGTDDFWRYALIAAVALIRASAAARQVLVGDVIAELAHRRSVTL